MATNVVPQGIFGPGVLILTRTDLATQTPYNVGYVNEFSYDFTFETKELSGQYQFPLLCARGTAKATGKIKAATLSGNALNTILLGGTWTTASQIDMYTSPSTAIPTTPYQITPTLPSSGTFNQDLGVINASTGEPLTLVTGTPSAGQYAQASGVYTFSSADHTAGVSVIITVAYSYTTGATGQQQTITNQLIGTTPTFQLDYRTILYGAAYYLRLFNCIGSKSSFAHKITDYMMPEYDFSFFATAAQQLGIMSVATLA